MSKKGIVISPPFQALPQGVKCGGSPNAQDIRKYLLYWDEIDYPSNNAIFIGLSPDLEFLENSGVLKRTHYLFPGGLIDGSVFISAQEHAFKKNEEQERGKWNLAQLSDSQFYTNAIPEAGIEFELFDCLPVPQADVPLNDILEFKQRRSSELLALRVHMDEMYQSIIIARDIPRAKNAALDRLELSLKNLNQTVDEFGIKKVVTSLRGTIGCATGAGLMAKEVATLLEASYALPAFAIGAAMSFAIRPMLLPQNTGADNPLTYVKSIREDLRS